MTALATISATIAEAAPNWPGLAFAAAACVVVGFLPTVRNLFARERRP
jgi:hypothetical protein